MNESGMSTFTDRVSGSFLAGPTLYMLAIASFFFTCFNLRCGNGKMAKISVAQMTVGAKVTISTDFLKEYIDTDSKDSVNPMSLFTDTIFDKKDKQEKLPVNYWAMGAFAAVLMAFLLSFFHTVNSHTVQIGLTGGALLSLVLMLFMRQQYALRIMNMDKLMSARSSMFDLQPLHLEVAWAYWVSLALLCAAFFVAMLRRRRRKAEIEQDMVLEMFDPGSEHKEEDPNPYNY